MNKGNGKVVLRLNQRDYDRLLEFLKDFNDKVRVWGGYENSAHLEKTIRRAGCRNRHRGAAS